MITYKIACASGVLIQGCSPDFLACIDIAREQKRTWAMHLPHSTLRVQFFYPNKKRVPSDDIKSALRSLADPKVAAAVARRRAASAQVVPGLSAARPGASCAAGGWVSAVALDVEFSQAGVVAPPDSPDLGNSAIACSGPAGF